VRPSPRTRAPEFNALVVATRSLAITVAILVLVLVAVAVRVTLAFSFTLPLAFPVAVSRTRSALLTTRRIAIVPTVIAALHAQPSSA
jgi:hypothetical protein